MQSLDWRADEGWSRAAWVFALAGAFFAWTAMPSGHWFDTPEFVATARRLSLSHSPGHPLHALYTHALQTTLPFGDAFFRANLGSALAGAGALALLYRLLRALNPSGPSWTAMAAALCAGCLPAVWASAARVEVYALQALLSMATIHLTLRVAEGDARALPLLALVFGLAGSNHTLIGAALIPAALLAMALGTRRWRSVAWACAAGAAGLMTYAYLPLRATAGGIVGWGQPDTLQAFIDTLMGKEWMTMANTGPGVSLFEGLLHLVGYLINQFSLTTALLLTGIFAAGVLGVGKRRLGALLVLLLATLSALSTKAYYLFDLLNPDVGGYLAGGLCGLLALAWLSVGGVEAEIAKPWTRGLYLIFPLALLWGAPRFDEGGRLGQRASERVARAFLSEAPPGGVMIFSDFSSNFGAWALRAVEGARPDVALIFRGQLARPWTQARIAREHPEHLALLSPKGGIDGRFRFEPGVQMQRLGSLRDHLRPAGLTLALGAPKPAPMSAWRRLAGPEPDIDTRRVMSFLHAQHALHLKHLRAPQALWRAHLLEAEALTPGDEMLSEIAGKLDAPRP